LCKATIESTLLRFTYQYIAVLFWFLCAGGLAALSYRLIFELSQTWNPKKPENRHFGLPARGLLLVLVFIPAQIVMIAFMFAQNIANAIQSRQRLPKGSKTRDKLVATFAGALNCQLGGPVIYHDIKHRMHKSGPARFPQSLDILNSIAAVNKTLMIFIIFSFLASACLYALNPGIS
jgi:adenosylcobinamide-phosphate synthase